MKLVAPQRATSVKRLASIRHCCKKSVWRGSSGPPAVLLHGVRIDRRCEVWLYRAVRCSFADSSEGRDADLRLKLDTALDIVFTLLTHTLGTYCHCKQSGSDGDARAAVQSNSIRRQRPVLGPASAATSCPRHNHCKISDKRSCKKRVHT